MRCIVSLPSLGVSSLDLGRAHARPIFVRAMPLGVQAGCASAEERGVAISSSDFPSLAMP